MANLTWIFFALLVLVILTLLFTFNVTPEQQRAERSVRQISATEAIAASPSPPAACADLHSFGKNFSCLQQALWGKCHFGFMSGCDASCGRCVSTARRRALRRTLLVSARQSEPCATAGADAWVERAMQNHAEYARQHGMQSTWSSALVDAAYDGAWNKMAFLQKVLRSELTKSETDWLLWVDWDAIFTDMAFELPLEEYEQRRLRLVIGGDPSATGGGPQQRADYLKANTGVMLLRVHNWTLSLVSRMLSRGGRTKAQRRKHALAIQQNVANLCVGCIDDQAVLLEALQTEPSRWAKHTSLERRYLLQAFWEDFEDALPEAVAAAATTTRTPVAVPLRRLGAPPLPQLRHKVYGLATVPLAVHFAGCQLCSGKAPEKSERCWPAFRRALRLAEGQRARR